MISEMVVMLLIGTLQIACPVCDVFLRIPLPGEKTLQKLRGVHNFALGFLGNVSVAERAPSVSPNLQMYVHAIKAKKKLSGPAKKQFKEFECILQGKLITARLNFFILISREVGPLLKIYQTEKPMTAFMCYDLSSLIRCLM